MIPRFCGGGSSAPVIVLRSGAVLMPYWLAQPKSHVIVKFYLLIIFTKLAAVIPSPAIVIHRIVQKQNLYALLYQQAPFNCGT